MLDSASQILPFLYLGSYLDAQDAAFLQESKIKKILNVSESVKPVGVPSIEMKHIPISDLGDTALEKRLPFCLEYIQSAKAAGDAILVHCHYGQNRSPCVVLAYLVQCEGMNLREAFARVMSARPMVSVHERYLVQLQELERGISGDVTF